MLSVNDNPINESSDCVSDCALRGVELANVSSSKTRPIILPKRQSQKEVEKQKLSKALRENLLRRKKSK